LWAVALPVFLLAHEAGAAERVVVQLSYLHQFQFAGIYAAEAQGYFREAGLDVEVRTAAGERRSAVREVQEGRADYGIAQSHQLVSNRIDGGDSVVLAAIMQHSPLVLVTRAEANLNTPHDLVGRRVALDNTAMASEIRAMLEREGVGYDRIKVVPNLWQTNELNAGTADAMSAFILDTPFLMQRQGQPVHIMRPLDYGVDFYGDCLFTTQRKLAAAPEQVARLRAAVLRGWQYALQHPEELIELILTRYPSDGPQPQRRAGLDRETLRNEAAQMAVLMHVDLVELGRINEGRWLRLAEIVRRYRNAPASLRLDNMLYHPPVTWAERLRDAGPWLLWSGLGAIMAALLASLTVRRLRRVIERRTRELRETQRRQRDLFEQSPAPIVQNDYSAVVAELARLRARGVGDLDAELAKDAALLPRLCAMVRVTDANQLALRVSGTDSVAELSRRRMELLAPKSLQGFREDLAAIWTGRRILRMERNYVMPDGRQRSMLVNWSAPACGDQPDYSRVQLVYTDVTEVRAALEALRQSEARYRELFEHAVNGLYRTTPTGRILVVNPAFAALLGFPSAAEMVAWFEQQPLATIYVEAGRREEFMRRAQRQDRVVDFESEVRRRDGSVIWVSENVRVVRAADGSVESYEGVVADITARRRLEAEMARASKLEAVGILAGGIAHDFNNILTVVLGNITLAESETASATARPRLLHEAHQATLRARDLTQQLLTFAKGGDPVRAAVELPDLLRESVGFALHGSNIRAEFELPGGLRRVNADKGQLGQVIHNLAINAVQAMPQGGILRLRAANEHLAAGARGGLPAGEYVCISVADTGVGIPAEHLAKIFDPYFTTKTQGSGLGLATVYAVISKHQGHIEVESQPGAGATFRFWLPVASAGPAVPPEETAPAPAPAGRVLFMDDEASILELARHFLSRLGLAGEFVADGRAAIEKYREARAAGVPFDVVVMDLTVPGGMGGREAMEHLRSIDPQVRAIVSSGYSRDPVLANYRAHGFVGILPKPYGLAQVQQVLVQVLNGETKNLSSASLGGPPKVRSE